MATLVAVLMAVVVPPGARAEAPPAVVVVMDFSGSMAEQDADASGTSRLEAAKTAVGELLDNTPSDAQLGLVAYGARNDSCGDVHTLNPVGPFEASALKEQVAALGATGNTPIGPALQHAARELAHVEGTRSIVLVSDGEPNCEPPPACEVAKELSEQGVDLTIHTVGFRIGGNTRAEQTLRCIAESTGGTFVVADDAQSLSESLRAQTTRGLETYTSAGTRVEGGETSTSPEQLTAGQYLVKLGSGPFKEVDDPGVSGNRRFFEVPKPEGWTLTISATLVPPAEHSPDQAARERKIALAPYGGRFCFFQGDGSSGSRASSSDTLALVQLEGEDMCVDEQERTVSFEVSRSGEAWAEQELDVELTVSYHRVDAAKVTPVPDPGSFAGGTVSTQPTGLAGGSSFNTAPVLQAGQTVTDTVTGGERRYFAVPVGFGQNLHTQVVFESHSSAPEIEVQAYNPLRQTMPFDGLGRPTLGGRVPADGGRLEDAGALWRYVDPQNLAGSDVEEPFGVAGLQYVVVGRKASGEGDDQPVRFNLTLTPWGTEVQTEAVQLIQTPEEFEAAFQSQPSPSPEQPRESVAVETTSPEPETTPPPEPQDPKPADDGSPWVLVLAGAGASLVLMSGFLVLLSRSGRRHP